VKIYEYGELESCIYIKMEIASKGTLRNYLSYPENLIDQKKEKKESLKE